MTSFPTLVPGTPRGFTVTTLTDWHVGTGRGQPGGIDRLVRRDDDRLPCIPASTIIGVWRDACEVVAAGLDGTATGSGVGGAGGGPGPWTVWVDALFGTQQPRHGGRPGSPSAAQVAITPARLPEPLRAVLSLRDQVAAALTFVKPGVAIDRATGAAADKMLRYEEMSIASLALVGQVELTNPALDADARRVATALLVMGACYLERFGAKRRRGAGRMRLRIDGLADDPSDVLDWVATQAAPPAPPPPAPMTPLPDQPLPATTDDWVVVDLRLKVETPLAIHHRTVGNHLATLDHVPGGMLLPSLLARLRPVGAPVDTAARLGHLVVTNAAPEIAGHAGRRVPSVLVREKGNDSATAQTFNLAEERSPDSLQTKAVRRGYVGTLPGRDTDLPEYATVERVTSTHNTIADDVQRPTADVGGVYSIEAISPLTPQHRDAIHPHRPPMFLRAELRLRRSLADTMGAEWWKALDGPHRFGRKSRADYGLVELTATPRPTPANGRQARGRGGTVRVWLLSDALVRDRRLRPSGHPDDVARAMCRALGADDDALRPVPFDPGDNVITWAAAVHRTESWHRGWGLSRATLAGVSAGSVGVFEIAKPVPEAAWRQLEITGFGERRAEGYGQVAVDDPLVRSPLSTRRSVDPGPPAKPVVDLLPSDGSPLFEMARRLELVAWRAEIDRRAEAVSASAGGRMAALGFVGDKPPRAQAGALRTLVGRLGPDDGPAAIKRWLDGLDAISSRGAKWPPETKTRIIELLGRPDMLFQSLGIDETEAAKLEVTRGGAAAARQLLAWDAFRALVVWCVRNHVAQLAKEAN